MTPLAYTAIIEGIVLLFAMWIAFQQQKDLAHLRKRLSREDRDDSYDPGPLTDNNLRRTLAGNHFPASKTLDRVQDAFERLLRERDELRKPRE